MRRWGLRSLLSLVGILVMMAVLPLTVHAADDVAQIGSVKYPSLQEAINAVQNNETITLLTDVTENVTISNKNCTIDLGGNVITSLGGCAVNKTGGTVVIQNGTITGSTDTGIKNNGTLTLKKVTVKGNSGTLGGGIKSNYGPLVLEDCVIKENSASKSGGAIWNAGEITIKNTSIKDNVATTDGGAIYYEDMDDGYSLTIEGGDITGNAAKRGSAAYVLDSLGTSTLLRLSGVDIKGNTDSGDAGAPLYIVSWDSSCTISNCTITENSGGMAGAIIANEVRLDVSGSTITHNEAKSTNVDAAGGIHAKAYSRLTMTSGLLKDNITAGSGKANDLYVHKNISAINVLAASAMNCDNSENLIWRDEKNGKIVESAITTKAEGFFTAIEKAPPIPAVYINGVSGSNNNDGLSQTTPVRTFAKAKEILEANEDLHTIYVLGKITVSYQQEWSLPEGAVLLRHPSFTGNLVEVRDSLKLSNIVIDGNSDSESGMSNCQSLIKAYGRVELGEGAVLQNNDISQNGNWQQVWGGAICGWDQESIIVIDGGTIQNCTALIGGGICSRGTVNLKSGLIDGNKTQSCPTHANPETGKPYAGCGGGITIIYNGTLEMSGGTISNNSSYVGGGIHLGSNISTFIYDNANYYHATMTMTGGKIDSNSCVNGGGGLFVAENARATVTSGEIIRNKLTGPTSYANFEGGGIYVNGKRLKGAERGYLKLENVVIKDNKTLNGTTGAGFASCPSSQPTVHLGKSGAIYNNKPQSGDKNVDVFVTSIQQGSWTGQPLVNIPDVMLGGGDSNWKYTGFNDDRYDIVPDSDVPANQLINYRMKFDEELSIYSTPSDNDIQKAERAAKVIISDNESMSQGSGIGSNGIVEIGEAGYGSLKIKKTVSGDGANTEKEFTFTISLGDKTITGEYGDVTFNEGEATFTIKHGQEVTASMLPEGVTYSVTEESTPRYAVVAPENASGSIEDDKLIEVSFENKYDGPEKTTIDVKKSWVGKPLEYVTVRLFADEEELDSVTLSEDNDWAHTFRDLDKYNEDDTEIIYTVKEDAVEGYQAEISGNADTGFTITNTEKSDPEGIIPTGDTNIYLYLIMLLIASGIFAGIILHRRYSTK